MAQIAQLLGIPEERLNQLTIAEAERLAIHLNSTVYSLVESNEQLRKQVQDKMQVVIRDLPKK